MDNAYTNEDVGILYSSLPFIGGKKIVRFRVMYGGPSPTPGTKEALELGCSCPGKIGDKDGYTIDELCPLHGREARRKIQDQAGRNHEENPI